MNPNSYDQFGNLTAEALGQYGDQPERNRLTYDEYDNNGTYIPPIPKTAAQLKAEAIFAATPNRNGGQSFFGGLLETLSDPKFLTGLAAIGLGVATGGASFGLTEAVSAAASATASGATAAEAFTASELAANAAVSAAATGTAATGAAAGLGAGAAGLGAGSAALTTGSGLGSAATGFGAIGPSAYGATTAYGYGAAGAAAAAGFGGTAAAATGFGAAAAAAEEVGGTVQTAQEAFRASELAQTASTSAAAATAAGAGASGLSQLAQYGKYGMSALSALSGSGLSGLAGSAALPALGTAAAGLIGANGAKQAAQTQADAATQAINMQQGMFDKSQANLKPFMDGGAQAMGQLNGKLSDGSLGGQFTPADYLANKDPGYQFQLDQGNQALQNSQAAKDGVLGGSSLKGLIDYNQGMASTGYQSAYNRWLTSQRNTYDQLSGTAGIGANAAGAGAGNARGFASAIGDNMTGRGNVLGAGQVGAANNYGKSIGGIANQLYSLSDLAGKTGQTASQPDYSPPTNASPYTGGPNQFQEGLGPAFDQYRVEA